MSKTGRFIRIIVVILVCFWLMILGDWFAFRFCPNSYNGICWSN